MREGDSAKRAKIISAVLSNRYINLSAKLGENRDYFGFIIVLLDSNTILGYS